MQTASARSRIAFFDAYALTAGAGIALCDLVERIDRSQFEPVALLPRHGPLADMLREVDCPIHVIEPPPPLGAYGRRLGGGGGPEMLGAARALTQYAWTVARWLRAQEIDLLHCNQTRAVFEAGAGGCIAGVPVVWNVRIREQLPRLVVRLCDEYSDLIIPLTVGDFAGLADEQRLLSRSVVIPNAVDSARFSPGRDRAATRVRLGVGERPLVLSAGVLVPRKGFDLAIRAMSTVVRVCPDAMLLIAGGEPDTTGGCRAVLEALAADLGLVNNVTFLGHREDMPDLLAACDLFVLASRLEGDPAVVLEAMATGRPVIATAPAAASVRDGVTGLVTPADDAEDLARAMLRLLAGRERSRAMGEAARRVVEAEHEIGDMVRRYEAAWAALLT
ncbi:MAG: glycosyltransferase [Armatimonadota bacterium]